MNLVRGAILKSLISYPNVCIQYVLYGSLIVDEKGGRDLASLADWGHVPMTSLKFLYSLLFVLRNIFKTFKPEPGEQSLAQETVFIRFFADKDL